jgi:hypothetical protein
MWKIIAKIALYKLLPIILEVVIELIEERSMEERNRPLDKTDKLILKDRITGKIKSKI